MTYPMILGFEVSGTVAALGPGVTGVAVGDRVAVFPDKGGAYAEKCVASASGLIKLPTKVGLDVGAAFPIQALTAYHMLFTVYKLKRGDTVLVNAIGGGVGLQCTQLAVHAGARVIGTTGTRGKEKRALDYGAARVVVTSQEDFEKAVLDFTGGKGVDLAINSYGADHARPHLQRGEEARPRDQHRRGRGPALQEPPRAHPAALADFYPTASRARRPELSRVESGRRSCARRASSRVG